MRFLASIQEIKNISPIENADLIELADVLGWSCVVKKDEFRISDKAVYFEIDSFLPIEGRYEFLRKSAYRNNEYLGEGFRIKSMRLRGTLSQGLLLPLSLMPECELLAVGTDVTELLKVKKWFIPEVESAEGTEKGAKPFGIPTTDETRIQSIEYMLSEMRGLSYYITTKMDGTSFTAYYKDGQIGICKRNYELDDDGTSPFWAMADRLGLREKLPQYGRNIAIQGEFCGHGIQKNRLRLLEPKLFVFDIVDLDSKSLKYYDYEEIVKTCADLGLDMVPVEEIGDAFEYNLQELLLKAQGKYASGMDKEGIVIRTQKNKFTCDMQRFSFKVLNNDNLLKED